MEEAITVRIDAELEDLIPGFLANRMNDIQLIRTSLSAGDFDDLLRLGHIMKGVGSGYGFPLISELGEAIEQAAARQDAEAIARHASQLSDYLNRITIVYEEQT